MENKCENGGETVDRRCRSGLARRSQQTISTFHIERRDMLNVFSCAENNFKIKRSLIVYRDYREKDKYRTNRVLCSNILLAYDDNAVIFSFIVRFMNLCKSHVRIFFYAYW